MQDNAELASAAEPAAWNSAGLTTDDGQQSRPWCRCSEESGWLMLSRPICELNTSTDEWKPQTGRCRWFPETQYEPQAPPIPVSYVSIHTGFTGAAQHPPPPPLFLCVRLRGFSEAPSGTCGDLQAGWAVGHKSTRNHVLTKHRCFFLPDARHTARHVFSSDTTNMRTLLSVWRFKPHVFHLFLRFWIFNYFQIVHLSVFGTWRVLRINDVT